MDEVRVVVLNCCYDVFFVSDGDFWWLLVLGFYDIMVLVKGFE